MADQDQLIDEPQTETHMVSDDPRPEERQQFEQDISETERHLEELKMKRETLPVAVYPTMLYHWDGRHQVVQNEAERQQLGEGWADSPTNH